MNDIMIETWTQPTLFNDQRPDLYIRFTWAGPAGAYWVLRMWPGASTKREPERFWPWLISCCAAFARDAVAVMSE